MNETYIRLHEEFSKARNPEAGRPYLNNTRLFKRGDKIAVQLHETDVVTIDMDGIVTLNTGGWYTHTTKDRMSYFVNIASRNHEWVILNRDGSIQSAYYDGMRISDNGKVLKPRKTKADRIKRLKTRIKTYVNKYCALIASGKLPAPSAGDCWYCAGVIANHNPDHLQSHMRECYYPPSLLILAYNASGYNGQLLARMEVEHKAVESIRRVLTKYIIKQLVR